MSVKKNNQLKQRNAVEAVRKEEASAQEQASSDITETLTLEEFDLADLEQMDVRHKNMSSSVKGSGCLTIINHEKCGRRIHLANSLWRDLGCPQFVKVFLKSKQMFVIPASTPVPSEFLRPLLI